MDQFEAMAAGERAHRPLLWVCLSFMLGIIINEFKLYSIGLLSFLACAAVLLSFIFRKARLATFFLLLGVCFTGAIYAKNDQLFSPAHINNISYGYRREPLAVEGLIVSDVQARSFFKGRKTVFLLEVKNIKTRWGWKEKKGQVLVNLFKEADLRYGDRVVLEGKLHRPFNFAGDSRFSYRDYLYRQGVVFILSVKRKASVEILKRDQGNIFKAASWKFKQRLSNVLKEHLPAAEAGFMRALLLGDRYDIPPQVYELFRLSGVAHIIAISGFNIAIVATGMLFFLRMFPIPRRGQLAMTIVFLVFYAFLTGAQPPVVRATIMATVFLMSYILERESNSINSLSLAALLILLMNPRSLYDVGFQLSFVSVLFIILGYPRLMKVFYRLWPRLKPTESKGRRTHQSRTSAIMGNMAIYFLQSLAVSLAAYTGVLGLVVYYFQIITPVVILANLVVVPLASLCIYLGMGLLVMGMLFPWLAFTFSNCLVILFNSMVVSVAFFTRIPGAYFSWQDFTLWSVIFYYGALILAVLSIRYLFRRTIRKRAIPLADLA